MDLKIFSANINGLRGKIDTIRVQLATYSPQLFCLQETKIAPGTEDNLAVPGYKAYRKDRNENGGGVAIYCTDKLKSAEAKSNFGNDLEILPISIMVGNLRICIITVYKPPKTVSDTFICGLTDVISDLDSQFDALYVTGDFNIDMLVNSNLLQPLCDSFSLHQSILVPTHKGKLIDLIFTPSKWIHKSTVNAPIEKFQLVTTVTVSLAQRTDQCDSSCKRKWSKVDFDLLSDSVISANLCAQITTATNVDEAWEIFKNFLNLLLDQMAPEQSSIRKIAQLPWITTEVKSACLKKEKLYSTWKRLNRPSDYAAFCKVRKHCKKLIAKAKSEYFHANIVPSRNMAKFWQNVNNCLGRAPTPLSSVCDNNNVILSDPISVANGFSDFFSSVWATQTDCRIDFKPVLNDFYPEILCDISFVAGVFTNMSSRVSTGYDKFPSILFKQCMFVLSPPVCLLINRCIKECRFPSDWKIAVVTPVPKIQCPQKISDFRPISVLTIVSKVFERHLKSLLLPFIDCKLHHSQYGFRQMRSTSDALMSFDTKINHYLKDFSEVVVVYFDVSKAFDRVPHHLLLAVLRDRFNIPSYILSLLHRYLYDRYQIVKVGSVLSDSVLLKSGVIQGSILGPLLYVAFTNDLGFLPFVGNSSVIQYADDVALMCPFTKTDSFLSDTQTNVDMIVNFLGGLSMSINATKTKSQVFSRTGRITAPTTLTVLQTPIDCVSEAKYLGVTLDCKLDYSVNTAKKVTAVKKSIGYTARVFRKSVPVKSLILLYISLFRSVLLYASESCFPSFKKDRLKLERCQFFALKCVFRDYKNDYKTLLFKAKLKPLYDLVFRFKMCLLHKYVCQPDVFPFMRFNADVSNSRLMMRNRHSRQLYVPHCNLSRYNSSSYILMSKAYNCLPNSLVVLPFKKFKNYLKIHSSELLADALRKLYASKSIVDADLNF